MKYINKVTNVILETDSHLQGGNWVLLEEPEEAQEEQPKPKRKK